MVVDPVRILACLVLVVATLGPLPGGTAGATLTGGPADHGANAPALVNLQEVPETDNTITRIVVHRNGSATWTLQIRTRLETDESEAEYRAFQDRFRENTSRYVGEFRESITGIVGNAREVTGREMSADGFRASTSIQSIPRRWGVVSFSFRWDGFAAREGEELRVGDVFEGGLFIAEGDTLEVVAPAGYRISSVAPTPDESAETTVTWAGREDFADRRPRVVLTPVSDDAGQSLPPLALLGGAALLVVAALSGVGYRWWRGRGADTASREDAGSHGTSSELAGSGDGELLADEDYVRRVLAEHDGRMRQAAVAEALDWSRSKTSRVLGRMEEAGQVEKLRLGRENVIALPEDAEE